MRSLAVNVAFLLASLAGSAVAQSAKPAAEAITPIGKFILDAFKAQGGDTLCSLGDVPVVRFEERVRAHLGVKAGDTVTQDQLEGALAKIFPCPFSPYRPELLAASGRDIEGAWLFPHDAQPYRYGPNSPQQPATPREAISCEAVGFFPGGEYRTGAIIGSANPCRFSKAADFDPARKRPVVAKWAMAGEGQVRITRTDAKDYAEEWDVFIATRAFQALNMEVRAGDLVAYRRGARPGQPNASTEFRLLQRLD